MYKNNLYIAFTICVLALAAVFFFIYGATQWNRDSSVEKLRGKSITVQEKIKKQYTRKIPTPEPRRQEHSPVVENSTPFLINEYAITAFENINEKKNTLITNPKWREDYELASNQKKWTDKNRNQIEAFIDNNRDLIREIRELAASGGPYVTLDYSQGYEMKLPHLAQLRDFARLLAADAAIAVSHGDYTQAIADYEAIADFANSLKSEPVLSSQLVRIALNKSLYDNVARNIQVGNMPQEMVTRLINQAGAAVDRGSFANSFSIEGLAGIQAFDDMRSGNLDQTGMSKDGLDGFMMWAYGSIFARPFLYMDEETYVDMINRTENVARVAFYEAQPELEQITADIENLGRVNVLSRMLLPTLTSVVETHAMHEAQMGLMQTGLAVDLYHEQTGVYPETLDEVAPLLGGKVPLDPYTGHPFVYEPGSSSYTLYSNRGSVIPPTQTSALLFLNDQDNIVWRGDER